MHVMKPGLLKVSLACGACERPTRLQPLMGDSGKLKLPMGGELQSSSY